MVASVRADVLNFSLVQYAGEPSSYVSPVGLASGEDGGVSVRRAGEGGGEGEGEGEGEQLLTLLAMVELVVLVNTHGKYIR